MIEERQSMEASKKILIVDDNSDLSSMIEDYLSDDLCEESQLLFDVRTANDAEKAIAMLRNEKYDILVCDVYMPGLSGYSVMTEARKQGIWPVIAMSGEKVYAETLLNGANHFIPKPINPEDIAATIKKSLS